MRLDQFRYFGTSSLYINLLNLPNFKKDEYVCNKCDLISCVRNVNAFIDVYYM